MYLPPALADLGRASAPEDALSGDAPARARAESRIFRPEWKNYIGKVWPRGARQVCSFMSACIAQGRGGDDDDERDRTRGPAVVCKLTVRDVHNAVALSNDSGDIKNTVAEQVLRTAQRAVALAQPPSTQAHRASKKA